jgi:voltage-gated potassium channel Kch
MKNVIDTFMSYLNLYPKALSRWIVRVLALCTIAALVTGIIGFVQYGRLNQNEFSLSTVLYQTVQLFFMRFLYFEQPIPVMLDWARWLAAASILLAVVEVAKAMFRAELTAFLLKRLSGHTVVCGLSQKTQLLVCCLLKNKEQVVVIDKAPLPDLDNICHHAGGHVIEGDATHLEVLRRAGVERAAQLYALCPDDSTNCEIAAQARSIRSQVKQELRCHVHLSDLDLRQSLQQNLTKDHRNVKIDFFDLFDLEARRLLREDLPLDRGGLHKDDPRRAHLVILGFGRMGRALALRAVQVGIFASGKPIRISVIDRCAEDRQASLLFRYPMFAELCDLKFHTLDAVTLQARNLIREWCSDKEYVTSVAICFDNEPRALEVAMQLYMLLNTFDVRLAVRMARQSGLAHLFKETEVNSLEWIRPFGVYEDCCDPELLSDALDDRLAKKIHEFYEINLSPQPAPPTVSDLPGWDDISEDFRESNRQQAAHIFVKLRTIDCEVVEKSDPRPAVTEFKPDQIEMLARMEHERWVIERKLAGWTLGPRKEGSKTNPYLDDWDKVPPKIQEYDVKFVRLIPKLLDDFNRKACINKPNPTGA